MGDVYKFIELVGTSENSIEDAVENAVSKAGETLNDLQWFVVQETRGRMDNNSIVEWQVLVKVAFTIKADPSV
jgi:flavin-binding protein dodecin